jgi:hypothetical protein
LFSAPGVTEKEPELTAVVTPEIELGVAVSVYEPTVEATRLLNVATPLETATDVVPEVKVL